GKSSTVFQERQAVAHTGDTPDTAHTGRGEIAGFDANQRGGIVQRSRSDSSTEWSLHCQQAVEDDIKEQRLQNMAPKKAPRAKWNLAGTAPREPSLSSSARRLQCNIGTGVPSTHQKDATRPEL